MKITQITAYYNIFCPKIYRATIFCCILIAFLLTACHQNNYLFEDKILLSDQQWHKDDTLIFDIPSNTSTASVDILLHVWHNEQYRYQNLWLFIEIISPGGKIISTKIDLPLADQYGWFGSRRWKTLQVKARLITLNLLEYGNYRLKIRQGMRNEALPYIEAVAVAVKTIEE